MRENWVLCVAIAVLVGATACSASLPTGYSGSIGLMPFWDEDQGIRGVRPYCQDAECTDLSPSGSGVYIVQQSAPVPMAEFVAAVVEQTDLIALPRSVGTYKGSALTWDLYETHTQVKDQGPGIYRIDLALVEHDGRSYLVALVTLPQDYAANPKLFDTLFAHMMYALAPLA